MNNRFLLSSLLIVMISFCAVAKPVEIYPPGLINGPSPVQVTSTVSYTFEALEAHPYGSWIISDGGTILSQTIDGTVHAVTVQWTEVGFQTIGFFDDSFPFINETKTVDVEAICPTRPATPSVTFSVSTSECAPRTITYTGTPPAGVTWYWQHAPSGKNLGNATNSLSITTSGTYYVRAYESTSQCWSDLSASTVVNVAANPSLPSSPTVSTNACGAKTLTRATPPTGVTWYWQGTDTNGLSTSNSATTFTANVSGTYVIRARNNTTLCWSAARLVTVTINPAQPVIHYSQYCGSPQVLSRGNPPGTDVWYWQGTNPTGTSTSNSSANYNVTTAGTYYLRARTSGGCWSPTATAVVVDIYTVPATPSAISVSGNTCGPKTLTKATAPTGFTYYWQDVPYSEDITPAAAAPTRIVTSHGTTGHFLRSRNNVTGCWSGATSVSVTVNNPPAPLANAFTYCDWETMTLTTTGYPAGGTLSWLDVATNETTIGLSITANKQAGSYSYKVSSRSAQNCVGSEYSYVTLTVPESCDENINWNEGITYTLDDNNISVPAGATRTYRDGHNFELQTQTKDLVYNKVLAKQPVYDRNGEAVLNTLPAPIEGSSFSFKGRFITNANGARYSYLDFDIPNGAGVPGRVDDPKPVGNTQPGTVGWYYSANNTLEPATPATNFPYSRSWTEDVGNPTFTKNTVPGNQNRMGSTREAELKQEKFLAGDLQHYFSLATYFGQAQTIGQAISWQVAASSANKSKFTPAGLTVVTEIAPDLLLVGSSQTTGQPGAYPIDGTISVVPGKAYTFWARGYRSNSNEANLYVTTASGTNLVWPGPTLPQGSSNMDWVRVSFTVPAGVTGIKVGVVWSQPAVSSAMVLNSVKLTTLDNNAVIGYRTIITDANEKQTVQFVDFEGRQLASAIKNGSIYENWSYAYYDQLGQVIAEVAPNGVDLASTAMPSFVTTYKYDHFGRMIESISADEGKLLVVYSTDGNVRFSQNDFQRSGNPQRFSYTNYDDLGRLIESGEYSMSGSGFYVFETVSKSVPSSNSILNIVDWVGMKGVTRRGSNATATRYSDTTFIEYDQQALDFVADTDHASQKFPYGQVTRTKNANATTWYSYDDYGQLKWSMQKIEGLGIKTIDYEYNFLGNVTEVIYQKGKSDAFYHRYQYDENQRLKTVSTGTSVAAAQARAEYSYYLHGPLKRLKFGTNVQGMDFVYTVDGSLKSINDADPERDPGEDGANGVAPDVFGQTLHRHAADFTSRDYQPTNAAVTTADQFGGAVKATSWHSAVDNHEQISAYAYSYDNQYQLAEAKFGQVNGTSFTPSNPEKYKEDISAYDKNGNILHLNRKGMYGEVVGNYDYLYQPNTNQLDKINHNGTLLVDYSYNQIGQMIEQVENGTTLKVFYNAQGLMKEVRDGANQLMTSYAYDDRGDLLLRTEYTAAGLKKTFYVNDVAGSSMAIYEQLGAAPLATLLEYPVYGTSRVASYRPQIDSYLYEITDHLGSVRAVVAQADASTYTATMETENLTFEEGDLEFKNIQATNEVSTLANSTPSGNEAARLNASKPVGPGISLKVSPGDVLDISTSAYYEAGSNYDQGLGASPLIAGIASMFGGISGAAGETGRIYEAFNSALGNSGGVFGLGSADQEDLPGAYVAYLVFDENKNFTQQGGYARVTESSNMAKDIISINDIVIEHPGYVYIFIYNRSNSPNFVFFDDFKIEHGHSPVVAGADYYPFGLLMEGRQITQEDYRWDYQGQFSEKDSVTGWNQFQLRTYDPRFGRWLSIDPRGEYASPYVAMGNIPNLVTDPTGGFTDPFWWMMFFQKLLKDLPTLLPEVLVKASRYSYLDKACRLFAESWMATAHMNYWENKNGGGFGNDPIAISDYTPEEYYEPPTPTPHKELSLPKPKLEDLVPPIKLPSAETIQTIASVAGLIPGANTVAGIIEAGAAIAAGDYAGAVFAGITAIPVIGSGVRWGKLLIQAHHVIPKAVIKQFALKAVKGFEINGLKNIKRLPFPFHAWHPQYNKYVANKVKQLGTQLDVKKLTELQNELKREIRNAWRVHKQGGVRSLNDYFRKLN